MRKRYDPSFDPTPDQPLGMPTPTATAAETLALVIVWCRTAPSRVGECALLGSRPMVIGRGGPRAEDHGDRVQLIALRPGKIGRRGPLTAPNLSRVHVRLVPEETGLSFERTGKGPVALDGVRRDHGLLTAGSTLLLANELLLYCERRPAQLPDSLVRTPDFAFGSSDAYGISGETAGAWRLRDQIRFAAGSGAPVLIVGPPGSGKDFVASAIHRGSASRDRPLVILGGATLGRGDIEALQTRTDAPFVVIDELGDVVPEAQLFLSRFIAFIGSQPPPRVRLVATSAVPLAVGGNPGMEAIRADLVSRFILTVRVPGLDERRADVPLMARAILGANAAEQPEIGARFFDAWDPALATGEPRLSPALVDRLVRHRWHAHARELTTLLWTAMTSATETWLDLTPEVMAQLDAGSEPPRADLNDLDAETVLAALEAAHGKVAVAAHNLGLKNRWVLYRIMEKLDIRP